MKTYADPLERINRVEEDLKGKPRKWLVTGAAAVV